MMEKSSNGKPLCDHESLPIGFRLRAQLRQAAGS
jgi:hypothetical protein